MKNLSLEFSENSKKVFQTAWKIKKKIFFDSSKPLLQHPLGGILRRVGPKNGQNGPFSFGVNRYKIESEIWNQFCWSKCMQYFRPAGS